MSQTSSGAQPAPGRRGKLLVVDDEVAIGRAISRIVRARHDVSVLTSGREAIERIVAGERYDAILCDLMMPDMSGIEVYDRLSRVAPESARRVIFLTGGAFTPVAEGFFRRVPNVRVEKPFDRATLLAAIESVILNTEASP